MVTTKAVRAGTELCWRYSKRYWSEPHEDAEAVMRRARAVEAATLAEEGEDWVPGCE